MLPEQKAYIYAWVDGVTAAGFRAGIYCSGIAAADDGKRGDGRRHSEERRLPRHHLLGDQRRLSAGARVRVSTAPSKSRRERRALCGGLAVRAVSAAQRRRGPVHQLQP